MVKTRSGRDTNNPPPSTKPPRAKAVRKPTVPKEPKVPKSTSGVTKKKPTRKGTKKAAKPKKTATEAAKPKPAPKTPSPKLEPKSISPEQTTASTDARAVPSDDGLEDSESIVRITRSGRSFSPPQVKAMKVEGPVKDARVKVQSGSPRPDNGSASPEPVEVRNCVRLVSSSA